MHIVLLFFDLICFNDHILVFIWYICPYSSGLHLWHWSNCLITQTGQWSNLEGYGYKDAVSNHNKMKEIMCVILGCTLKIKLLHHGGLRPAHQYFLSFSISFAMCLISVSMPLRLVPECAAFLSEKAYHICTPYHLSVLRWPSPSSWKIWT